MQNSDQIGVISGHPTMTALRLATAWSQIPNQTKQWNDYRLRWDPRDFGNVTSVDYAGESIWKPDIGLINGRHSAHFDFSTAEHSRVTIRSDGMIMWLHGAVLDVTCPLDFSRFPFDTQTCYLIITPWQSTMKQIQLQPMQHGPTVDNNYLPNSNVSEWKIEEIQFSLESYRSQFSVAYQYIKVSIRIKRQPLYFVIMVLVPFFMLSWLACLIFTIGDTGDRLAVALSLILSMTMYVVIVSSNAPRSMRTVPLLGIFLLDQLGLLCIATIVAVLNNKTRVSRTSHKQTEKIAYINSECRNLFFSDISSENSPTRGIQSREDFSNLLYPGTVCIDHNSNSCSYHKNTLKGSQVVRRPHTQKTVLERRTARPLRQTYTPPIQCGNYVIAHPRTVIEPGRSSSSSTGIPGFKRIWLKISGPFQESSGFICLRTAGLIDMFGIVIYLTSTLLNAMFCLYVLPYYSFYH
ncbi:hypothetical protein CRM22_006152 [Opisthorchis felineus]|uniref:Neurotransmitter-gated ion-channel ligand-binding domain-containing protein n=1 Tax=Opisthorchis felineus TaxID=147828 RepID=A0A4S2LTP4_OPIFE|nr:hypothetical protein CRM22_006152 [Opisthorchis felineus]